MYMLKRYVDVYDDIYIYMVQFLESSKEGLLKNRRPSNNRISLKNRTGFFCRPGMSLKKYSFLRTSCPEFFKENSQEDYIYIALAVGFLRVMMGYFQVGTNASGMAQPCPCLPTPGILGTENQFT